jgi:truncated hemoglobin YjbI
MTSPLAESYGPPRLLTDPEIRPLDRWAEHVARSVARADPAQVARFRFMREVERIAAEAGKERVG